MKSVRQKWLIHLGFVGRERITEEMMSYLATILKQREIPANNVDVVIADIGFKMCIHHLLWMNSETPLESEKQGERLSSACLLSPSLRDMDLKYAGDKKDLCTSKFCLEITNNSLQPSP